MIKSGWILIAVLFYSFTAQAAAPAFVDALLTKEALDACRAALAEAAPARTVIANFLEIDAKVEANEYLDASLANHLGPLVLLLHNQPTSNPYFRNLSSAGLSVTFEQGQLTIRHRGRQLLRRFVSEPIADVRFVRDSQLAGLAQHGDSGYLSIIGWVTTRYYHFDGSKLHVVNESEIEALREITSPDDGAVKLDVRPSRVDLTYAKFAAESRQLELLKAAGVAVDPERFHADAGYRDELFATASELRPRVSEYLFSRENHELEVARLNRLARESAVSRSSLLRRGLGELGELVITAARRACAGEPTGWLTSDRLPWHILAMSAHALTKTALQEQMAMALLEAGGAGFEAKALNRGIQRSNSANGVDLFRIKVAGCEKTFTFSVPTNPYITHNGWGVLTVAR